MEIHERLRTSRLRAGFHSAAAAARAFGWPIGTYAGHENGHRGLGLSTVERYARAFRVDPTWLILGLRSSADIKAADRAAMHRTLTDLIARRGPHLLARDARTILVDEHGAAPPLEAIQEAIELFPREPHLAPALPDRDWEPDIEPDYKERRLDGRRRGAVLAAMHRAQQIAEIAELSLDREQTTRLAGAIYRIFYTEGAEADGTGVATPSPASQLTPASDDG